MSCCFFMGKTLLTADYADSADGKRKAKDRSMLAVQFLFLPSASSAQSAVSHSGHLAPQIREQIAPRDQPEKLISVHDDGDAATVEDPKQIRDLRGGRKRFEAIGHRGFYGVVKMIWIVMHFHEHIGLI